MHSVFKEKKEQTYSLDFHPDSQDYMQFYNIVAKIHSLEIVMTSSELSAL